VWLFGAENKFAPVVTDALKPYGASLDASGLRTSSTAYDASDAAWSRSRAIPPIRIRW